MLVNSVPFVGDHGQWRTTSLADAMHSLRVRHSGSPCGGRQNFFCDEILQHGIVQHRLGQKPFQPTVLVPQRLQPLGLRHVEAAVLGLPVVERRIADAVLTANIHRLGTRLLLPQDPDDLLFREP